MTPTAAGLARLAGPTDADLLARFTTARDAAAFAELVRRHGPAVLAVCRRLTGHAHDAEDAFQAAFLVLARKAGLVRPGEPVAAWLYGVAVRAARNAAARAWRRRGRETLVEAVPDVPARPAEPFDPDAAAAVLDEVGRLPALLRSAVILCELEGRPRAAAARELGVAAGTLSSRLAAARKRLAARLAARGFAPAALAVLAPAAVPSALADAATALASGPAPAAVASLARGVVCAMFLKQLRLPAALGLLAAALAAAALAAPQDPPTAPPPKADPAPKADAPAAKAFDALVVGYNPGAFSPELPAKLTFTPDGKCVYEVAAVPARGTIPAWPATKRTHTLSRDRAAKLAAVLKATDGLTREPEAQPLLLHSADYAVTLRRDGAAKTLNFHGEEGNYKDLLLLVRGVASQEFLGYLLEDAPGRSADARAKLDSYVRAELGGPYGKSVDPIDFARFGGWASRVLRTPADRPADEVATAARLAGLLRLASEREALDALMRHDSSYVREAVIFARARLPESK